MFCIPGVDAGQINVFPAQRRDVLEQMIRNLAMHFAQMTDGPFDVDRIPMHDRANDEVEAGGAERLAFERSVPDLSALVEEDGALQLMCCLALVEAAWHRRRSAELEYHSIMNNDRSIRPSSRSALASWLSFGDADSFFRIVDGTTDRVVMDAARWSRSSQCSRIRVVLIGAPMWFDNAGYASPFSNVWNFRSLRLRSRGAKRLPIKAKSPKT